MTYDSTILAESALVSYWTLGEASGTTASDSKGTNHGTYTGGCTLGVAVAGDSYTAVTFNGTTGYVTVPDAASLDLGDVVSIEAWVQKGAAGAARGVLSKGQNAYYMRLSADTPSPLVQGLKGWTGIVSGSAHVIGSGWHHIVFTKNGSTRHVYVDGADDTGSGFTDATFADNAVALMIGADSTNGSPAEFSNATMRRVALYNAALTSAQVAAHYAAGTAAPGATYSAVLTGAGVATVTESTARSKAPTLTGAGVATLVGKKAASAALTLTGAGTATLTRTSARSAAAALTGAGTATIAATAAEFHSGSVSLTGAGVATVAVQTARAKTSVLSGAGAATIAARKGALAAPAVTGAGALTAAVTTARAATVTLTGAGVATITTAAESHSSSVAATGAGAVTASITSARFVAALLSGGGVLTDAHSTARAGAITGTGGGTVTVDAIAAIPLGLAAHMRIASEPVEMRIASVSDVPTIRRTA